MGKAIKRALGQLLHGSPAYLGCLDNKQIDKRLRRVKT